MNKFKKQAIIIVAITVLLLTNTGTYADSLSDGAQSRLANAVVLYIGSPKAYVNNILKLVDPSNPNVTPVVESGRTLVPVRFISESYGAAVSWDNATNTITIKISNKLIKMIIGSKIMSVDNKQVILDAPAEIINGKTYIPLRRLVEDVLNKKLFYDSGLIVISDNENLFDAKNDSEMINEIASSLENKTVQSVNPSQVYNVKDYGAKGDGGTLDTDAIQSAIDASAGTGGGEVYFPKGTYKTVGIQLKSNVTLNIDEGALLVASTTADDWTSCDLKPVIFANSAENVSIKGSGTIDGGGLTYYNSSGSFVEGDRPQLILMFRGCKNVNVSGIKLQNSVMMAQIYDRSENVTIDGVKVRNREYIFNHAADGIDIQNCSHVVAKNLDIETGDDGICLKSMNFDPSTNENMGHPDTFDVLVENCTVATPMCATKIGTGTTDGVYNCTFRNITVNRHSQTTKTDLSDKTGSCKAAISLQSNDGGATHDIVCENYTINDCKTPIFLEVENRQTHWEHPSIGKLYNITLSEISCSNSVKTSQFNCGEGGEIDNVILKNITIHNKEVISDMTNSPKRPEGEDPQAVLNSKSSLPAYGLFVRDVKGLTFSGRISFYDDNNTGRPKTVFENVTGFVQK